MAAATAWAAGPPSWPDDGAVERGWGVNIHFTQAQPGELDLLAASGAYRVRTDFSWADTEKQPGQYDFSVYAQLTDDLAAHGLRPWFILDYENALYSPSRAVATDEARAAFARWAGAAAAALRGRGVIWEIWNEPNNAHFWEPQPDPVAYTALALAATRAIKAVDPDAVVVGPASALVDLNFLRACGEAGLFGLWDGVSVHPYRRTEPETAAQDFREARALLRRYTPPGRTPPALLVGEWGYSLGWADMDEDRQAAYAARMELADLAAGVPLTIWYDWRDDGADLYNPEHHFGLVRQPYHDGATPVLDAKPAYEAMAALARELRYYRLNKALTQSSGTAHLLIFERRPGAPAELPPLKLAVWTAHPDGHEMVTLPIGPGLFRRVDGRGRVMLDAEASDLSLQMQATALPQYLTPVEVSPRLQLLAAWERWPDEFLIQPGDLALATSTWVNTLGKNQALSPEIDPAPLDGTSGKEATLYAAQNYTLTSAAVPLLANAAPIRARTGLEGWWQETWLTPAHPLSFELNPLTDEGLTVSVPDAPPSWLTVHVGTEQVSAQTANGTVSVLAPTRDLTNPYGTPVSASLSDAAGRMLEQEDFGRVSQLALVRGPAGSPSGLRAIPDGSEYGSGDIRSRWDNAPAGPATAPAVLALRVDFSFGAEERFYRFEPGQPAGLAEWPRRVGFWIYGDDAPVQISLRLSDVTGQTFQPASVRVQGRHWQAVWLDLDPAQCSHSGGQNDGHPHSPLSWDCYFRLDKVTPAPAQGTLYLLPPTLVDPPQ